MYVPSTYSEYSVVLYYHHQFYKFGFVLLRVKFGLGLLFVLQHVVVSSCLSPGVNYLGFCLALSNAVCFSVVSRRIYRKKTWFVCVYLYVLWLYKCTGFGLIYLNIYKYLFILRMYVFLNARTQTRRQKCDRQCALTFNKIKTI